jgi:hypothetical protein
MFPWILIQAKQNLQPSQPVTETEEVDAVCSAEDATFSNNL